MYEHKIILRKLLSKIKLIQINILMDTLTRQQLRIRLIWARQHQQVQVLGVIIDSTLKFRQHAQNIINKIDKVNNMMKMLKRKE